MRLPRRTLLTAAASLAGPALAQSPAPAQSVVPLDQAMAERSVGRPDAPTQVIEYFSLTCSHCATFHRDTFPRVKRELIDSGAVRLIWRDFPLDQLALLAAMVARALPAERYEGFIGTLLSNQDRWAFTREDAVGALGRMAALAGMSAEQYAAVQKDDALRRAVVEERLTAERDFKIEATPSFVFGRQVVPGEIPFERFQQLAVQGRG